MEDDYSILEETALEEMSAAFEEDRDLDVDFSWADADFDSPETDDYDYDDELAFESDMRRGVYDDWPSEFED